MMIYVYILYLSLTWELQNEENIWPANVMPQDSVVRWQGGKYRQKQTQLSGPLYRLCGFVAAYISFCVLGKHVAAFDSPFSCLS